MIDIGDPVTEYKEPCGCIWKHGRRIHVCPKHRHKDGISLDNRMYPKFRQ